MQQHSLMILPKNRLDDLFALLRNDGFEVVGPRVDQGAVVYDRLESSRDLPIGWTDLQTPGSYRLEQRQDETYFGYAVGPHSWKKYLFPASLRLWQATRTQDGFTVTNNNQKPPRFAFVGVRPCELHAIATQHRTFANRSGDFTDPFYANARAGAFLIAVECQHPAETCFCTSMGTGPDVDVDRLPLPVVSQTQDPQDDAAVDLVLTELDGEFVVRNGSKAGRDLIHRLQLEPASEQQCEQAHQRVKDAAGRINRKLDTTHIRDLLHRNQEHPRWDNVAQRCLGCANCTLVCPTCFCFSVQDVNDLTLEHTERVRHWDSCFNPEFAQVHGGNHRSSLRARYRQWLTHKFASWYDQFGVSGCVGCGRCITWCPVGIDVTEEITAIRSEDGPLEEKPPCTTKDC